MLALEAGLNLFIPDGHFAFEIFANVLSNAQRVQNGTHACSFESSIANIALLNEYTFLCDYGELHILVG